MSSEPILSGSELTEEITELREEVLTYKPGNVSTCADKIDFPEQLHIGLFGRTGCGKTSLINSLKFAAHGKLRRLQWNQAACQEKAGGHTMFRKLADITKKIFVIDNRGLDEPNTEKAITELALQLGLFGRTGCGKTSLINSLKFAAHGKLRRLQWNQAACQEKAGGHTMFRKLADITKKIFVIDNRGLDEPNTEKAITELALQLDGDRGYSESVEWQGASDGNDIDDTEDGDLDLSGLDLKTGHPIGCAIFVFSARHELESNTNGLAEVIDFLHGHQGRYPVAIITHVDVVQKNNVDALKTVLKAYGVSDIFEVANLTTEKKLLEEPYQHSLLSLLERCMTDGDETLIFKHYQRKEQQRKKEIEKRREEKRRKQEEERIAEACRQMAEKERVERENQMRRELEEQRRAIQGEREQAEKQARERQEQERDRRHQEAIARLEREKQVEIRRIMEANKKDDSSCEIM